MIELYSDKYKVDLEWMVQKFQEESLSEFGIELNLEVLRQTVEEIKDEIYLLVRNGKAVGIVAGKPVNAPMSGDKVWHEMIWFVLKEYRNAGVFMLNEVKKILKDKGYTAIIMVCMENSKKDKLFNLYRQLGFVPMEHHFIGRL